MKGRAESIIQKLASEFINRESNRTSLITVTQVEYDDRTRATSIFISTYPEKDTRGAVEFLNRNRDEFRDYIKKHSRLARLPRVLFQADPVLGGSQKEVIEPTP
jgi:ribosome-binding factor A